VPLVKEPLVPDGLQRPPLGLDVVVLIGDVGVFHVGPETNPVRHLLPFLLVLPHALLALVDKRLDTVTLDLRLTVDPERLFDFKLDRQAMGVPASLALHLEALHGLVARDDVLDDTRQDMTDVRLAVGGRRTVVKSEFWTPLPVADRLFEDPVLLPERQGLLFARNEFHVAVNFFVHRFPPAAAVRGSLWSCPDSVDYLSSVGSTDRLFLHIIKKSAPARGA